jgi:hypothetical protein
VRVGFGFDRQVSENWAAGFKVGVQHAFRTEYDTTLPGEVFILKGKDEVIVGLTMTYTGGFWIPAPPPPPP